MAPMPWPHGPSSTRKTRTAELEASALLPSQSIPSLPFRFPHATRLLRRLVAGSRWKSPPLIAHPGDPPRPQTKPSSSSAAAFPLTPVSTNPPSHTHHTHKAKKKKSAFERRAISGAWCRRDTSVSFCFSAHARLCCGGWEEPKSEAAARSSGSAGGGRSDGKGTLLRQEQGPQERALDAGGGQAPRRLHPDQRPWQLAPAPQARRSEFLSLLVPSLRGFHRRRLSSARPLVSHSHWPKMPTKFLAGVNDAYSISGMAMACRAEPVRQELPTAVDQLPPAGHQARALHSRGGEVHRPAPRHRRQQVRKLLPSRGSNCMPARPIRSVAPAESSTFPLSSYALISLTHHSLESSHCRCTARRSASLSQSIASH